MNRQKIRAVFCALIFLRCAVAFASAKPDKFYERLFRKWVVDYNKTYATPEEYDYRMHVFTANARFVEAENSRDNPWQVGLNALADITNEEYRATYLTVARTNATARSLPPVYEETKTGAMPRLVNTDWRTSGCVTAVKNQSTCGACYAFGATGCVEFAHCRAGNPVVALSEEQLIDCSSAYGNSGCSGGYPESAWDYAIAYGGIDTSAYYPYQGVAGTCTASLNYIGGRITGWNWCTATDAGLQSCIQARVVTVTVDASLSSFQLYSG